MDIEIENEGRILVVDDNEMNRELLSEELGLYDFEVIEASGGEECLARAREDQPEVIVLDIKMPEMDGIETCRRLKEDREANDIPVLFLTAFQDDETIVAALEAGGNDFISKPYSHPILIARIRSQVSIYRTQEKLRELAMTDELTGVYSRRFLFQTLRRAVKASTRSQVSELACMMVDIDHFKEINDQHGHRAGDAMLRHLARTIEDSIRDVDTLARFGGDEFTVVLPDTTLEEASQIGERIRSNVAGQSWPNTVSIGAAHTNFSNIDSPPSEETVDEIVDTIIKQADRALYEAKQQGRNQVATVGS